MDGVILFADDEIFKPKGVESLMYAELSSKYPVLAVDSLELARKAINSIGTFSVVILDWEFLKMIDGNEKKENASIILDTLHFYSLIYVFTNTTISNTVKARYKLKFSNRIIFKRKFSSGTPEYKCSRNISRIINNISTWNENHKKQYIPLKWSNSVNQSIQKVFSELSSVNENWIIELYKSAEVDVNPAMQVVILLQSLLQEQLISNSDLLTDIQVLVNSAGNIPSNVDICKLFQRIYYTKLTDFNYDNYPIMTGDIVKLGTNEFAILITPECDIKKIINDNSQNFSFIRFKKDDIKTFKNKVYGTSNLNPKNKEKFAKHFNQDIEKLFFLPSFPFKNSILDYPVIIDFSESLLLANYKKTKTFQRLAKLNAPYIQQLRQRYLGYLGRVGVPTIPSGLTSFNIAHF